MSNKIVQSLTRATILSGALAACSIGFSQTVFDSGHLDIGIAYESGEWNLHLHDEENELEIEPPNTATIQINANALTFTPSNPSYSFLGSPGSSIWVLPKSEDPNLLFLGFGTEELTATDWASNIEFTLKAVSGPGDFFLWDVDSFSNPTVLMNSRDGINASDKVSLIPESHGHFNLGFNQPGEYSIFFEANGTHVIDGFSRSGDIEYRFSVVPEPSTTAIGAIALLTIALLRRSRTQTGAGKS